MNTALQAMSALAQPTRLATFSRLVQAGGEGVSAGELAEAVGAFQNTMSAHLTVLARAGLVQQRRSGRHLIYTAVPGIAAQLSGFLAQLASGSIRV